MSSHAPPPFSRRRGCKSTVLSGAELLGEWSRGGSLFRSPACSCHMCEPQGPGALGPTHPAWGRLSLPPALLFPAPGLSPHPGSGLAPTPRPGFTLLVRSRPRQLCLWRLESRVHTCSSGFPACAVSSACVPTPAGPPPPQPHQTPPPGRAALSRGPDSFCLRGWTEASLAPQGLDRAPSSSLCVHGLCSANFALGASLLGLSICAV